MEIWGRCEAAGGHDGAAQGRRQREAARDGHVKRAELRAAPVWGEMGRYGEICGWRAKLTRLTRRNLGVDLG